MSSGSFEPVRDRGLPQADDVAPDYKTQASALLYGDPYDWYNLNQPDSIADYLRTYLLRGHALAARPPPHPVHGPLRGLVAFRPRR
jgi:hypothetical protein